jgi:hypothetical protein
MDTWKTRCTWEEYTKRHRKKKDVRIWTGFIWLRMETTITQFKETNSVMKM